jgi:hypothetical protein
MNLRGRLRAIEKARSASRLTGQDYRDKWGSHDAAIDAWEREFIAGRSGPFPPDKLHPWVNLVAAESTSRFSACMTARMERLIGETDYLPGMNEEERFRCDQMCGLIWVMACDPASAGGWLPARDEGPFSWPGWEKFRSVAYAVGPPRDSEPKMAPGEAFA